VRAIAELLNSMGHTFAVPSTHEGTQKDRQAREGGRITNQMEQQEQRFLLNPLPKLLLPPALLYGEII